MTTISTNTDIKKKKASFLKSCYLCKTKKGATAATVTPILGTYLPNFGYHLHFSFSLISQYSILRFGTRNLKDSKPILKICKA